MWHLEGAATHPRVVVVKDSALQEKPEDTWRAGFRANWESWICPTVYVWFQCKSLFFKVQFTLSTALLRGCVHLSMFGTLSARVRRQTGFHDFQEDNGSDRGHCVRASDVTFLNHPTYLEWCQQRHFGWSSWGMDPSHTSLAAFGPSFVGVCLLVAGFEVCTIEHITVLHILLNIPARF